MNPPAWLFPPVWTALYSLGYAAHHATTTGLSSAFGAIREMTGTSQTLYSTQLMFNYLRMPLLFVLRRADLALVDVLALGGERGGIDAHMVADGPDGVLDDGAVCRLVRVRDILEREGGMVEWLADLEHTLGTP